MTQLLGDAPEQRARRHIDAVLHAAGWEVQDYKQLNLAAARGIAVREVPMKSGHGFADYLHFVDRQAVGLLEAKAEGHTLSGVEAQARRYSEGLPDNLKTPVRPLPFLYRSTGSDWQFTTSDVKGDAGQYFTPRPLIDAIVECVQPTPDERVCDPACGTGGFLLAAYDWVAQHYQLDKRQKKKLRFDFVRGVELVDQVTRLCAMNLLLHGIGPTDDETEPPVQTDDALRNEPSELFEVVLTNPPFGKKSSTLVVTDEGQLDKEKANYARTDFWTSTSNKQLNFIQHVKSLVKMHGRAALVVPDNVLFEGGAGETIRRRLLQECDVHTLLRLPTGIFYAQGVKANVLFFDRRPGREKPWTEKDWVYDFRTNVHMTLKTKRLVQADLDDFVACFKPCGRDEREAK